MSTFTRIITKEIFGELENIMNVVVGQSAVTVESQVVAEDSNRRRLWRSD